MCVALINTNNAPGNQNIVRAMADKISHRGPDGEGYWTHKNVAFGHRRLSIIDLTDGGSQPMQTEDGRYTICYNGELYNFADLKLALQASGETFVSRSDTEVVLKAVANWGIEKAMSSFNGIIAFAIYDAKEHRLYIARDRYGIKPLYYCTTKDSILFASEIKAFAGHPNVELKLDPEGLVEYFTFQNFLSERTLFKDVKMFPAGHYATVDCAYYEELRPVQYWDFDFREPTKPASKKEMLSELRFLFEKAVSSQLMSDVEVSSYLSGGMDSGSITAVAAKILPFMRTFTCGFDLTSASGAELNFDERKVAEKMSYLFNTEHYAVCLKSGDMQRAVPDLVYHLDEPRVGQSYPNYYVAGLASKFGKVVLGGTGGDEIFGGYPWRYYNVAGARSKEEFAERYFKFWQRLVPLNLQKEVFAPIWE
ncbi:Asparagine synthetase [glutamine-hydrolyzing] 1 [Nymphon striatum]|nr:Asparagine synthetase [glutamine-hydrolyzing] 1 [Nymphon striatum]